MEELLNEFLVRHACQFEVKIMPVSSADDVYQESPAAIYIIYPSDKLIDTVPYMFGGYELNSIGGLFASTEDLVYRDGNNIYLQFLADQLPPEVVDKLLLPAFKEGVRETLQLQNRQFQENIISAAVWRLAEYKQNIKTYEDCANCEYLCHFGKRRISEQEKE